MKKDQIEVSKTFAILQALVSKDVDKTNEALESYRNAQMPYLAGSKKRDRQDHIKRLMAEVGKGPMAITPVMSKKVQSKLRTKVVQRTEEPQAAQRSISKKIGSIV